MFRSLVRPLRSLARRAGYDVVRVRARKVCPQTRLHLTDIDGIKVAAAGIPGMIGEGAAGLLYALFASQALRGDVVEIGSWLGKSTSFLGRAVKDSRNGRLFAVDHFRGNVGRERSYRFRKDDLSDLREAFEGNMRAMELQDVVTCIQSPSAEARPLLNDKTVRLLFIDGDHTEAGAQQDIELFVPLVPAGGLVIFDDFDSSFPGLIRAVERWAAARQPASVFWYEGLLVCRL